MDSFQVHRPRLLSLAYRVLNSFAEAEDVVQALNVVSGANNVARLMIGVAKKGSPSARYEMREVNGWPSLVGPEGDTVVSLCQLETDGQLVYSVLIQLNPDKLRAVMSQVGELPRPLGHDELE